MLLLFLLKRPLFWLAALGIIPLLVLAFWYIKRPTDAIGQGLIPGRGAQKKLAKDLARRTHDSVRATQPQAAAATLYEQGERQEVSATRLHQQTHEIRLSTADTNAQRLQRALSDY